MQTSNVPPIAPPSPLTSTHHSCQPTLDTSTLRTDSAHLSTTSTHHRPPKHLQTQYRTPCSKSMQAEGKAWRITSQHRHLLVSRCAHNTYARTYNKHIKCTMHGSGQTTSPSSGHVPAEASRWLAPAPLQPLSCRTPVGTPVALQPHP